MAVRRIKNHWWVDIRHKRLRKRLRSPEDSRRGAQAFETHVRHRLVLGESFEDIFAREKKKDDWIFAEYIEHWFEIYVTVENKPSEQCSKRVKLDKHILPYFGKMRLKDIREQHISKYKALKRKTLGAKTVNNHLAVLGKCLRSAHEWGDIDSVPRYKLLRVDPPNTTSLTEQECKILLDAASSDPFWYAFILCGLCTGMRLGELFGLTWENVSFSTEQIWIRQNLVNGILGSPKSNRYRQVPLALGLAEVLYPVRKQKGYVFQLEGRPLNHGLAWNALRRIKRIADLPDLKWHTLRHTFASLLTQKNVPLTTVQALLGHSTIQMTMRYAHLAPNSLTDALAYLPAFTQVHSAESGHQVGTSIKITAPKFKIPLKSEALISAKTT